MYYALILCFILPSGNILVFPIKLIVTFACTGMFVVWIIGERKNIIIDKMVIAFFMIIMFASIWSFISIINGYSTSMLMCFKALISLLLIVMLSYLLHIHSIINYKKVYSLLVFVAIATVVIKLISELVLVFNIIEWNEYRRIYTSIFGSELTTMEMQIGDFTFYRLMTTNDSIPLIIFAFFVVYEKRNIIKKLLVVFFMSIYTLIVYSRMVIFQFAVLLFVCAFCFLYDFIKRTTVNRIIFLSIGIIAVFVAGFIILHSKPELVDNIKTTIEERFFSETVEFSDSFRDKQYKELWQGFKEKPILGHGLGSYIIGYQRSTSSPFSYEAEYLSFLFQFGILGMMFIILPIIAMFFYVCLRDVTEKKLKLIVFVNLCIWAIKPFFNPQFLSSNSGIVIVTILMVKCFYNTIKEEITELKGEKSYVK